MTIPAADAAACVSWATGLRKAGVIETYSLSPSTLEDAYLALTEAPETDRSHETSEETAA